MRRFVAALTSLVLILNQSAAPAWVWGRTGHRVIAKLAERHLSDRARAEIRELLESDESLADCSTWADDLAEKNHRPPLAASSDRRVEGA
jgi:S1/P1 Nuclease